MPFIAPTDRRNSLHYTRERQCRRSNHDVRFAARNPLPETAAPGVRVPAVGMAHGLGAVKEMYLEPFAHRLAEAGTAALVFDYRGFGASGGEPRQRISPPDQMEDYRNALTWLSLQPEIDANRLGVWGSSFSGGSCANALATQRYSGPPNPFGYFVDLLGPVNVVHWRSSGCAYSSSTM
jgi:fermentation-respiration switch protein FrsA (DUF1100 family)